MSSRKPMDSVQKVCFVRDVFRMCKSGNACIFEVGAGTGEVEMAYVQVKKVLLEFSRVMLTTTTDFVLIDWNRNFQL